MLFGCTVVICMVIWKAAIHVCCNTILQLVLLFLQYFYSRYILYLCVCICWGHELSDMHNKLFCSSYIKSHISVSSICPSYQLHWYLHNHPTSTCYWMYVQAHVADCMQAASFISMVLFWEKRLCRNALDPRTENITSLFQTEWGQRLIK